jgi:DNA ligase-3
MTDNRFCIDYGGRQAGCKKCKQKIEKGQLRIAKITASPFSDDGEMKNYHHPACIFEVFKKARATTKIIEDPGDLEGWDKIEDEDKEIVKKLIKENPKASPDAKKKPASAGKKKKVPASTTSPAKAGEKTPPKSAEASSKDDSTSESPVKPETRSPKGDLGHKDNSFREFRRVCAMICEEPSYLNKTDIARQFFKKGSDCKVFKGDLYVWVRLLLPGTVKRIYNIQSKQIVKIYSRILGASEDDMLEDLEAGDVAETVTKFFDSSDKVEGAAKSKLTMHDVDAFLDRMAGLTKEEEQQHELSKMTKRCTSNDVKMIIR